ncbi:MAG: flotillin-like protein FloA [Defluviitaleaceae bacterium]|nr:flotillin-like protein FloA [Defluviitaleaceae bacterium]
MITLFDGILFGLIFMVLLPIVFLALIISYIPVGLWIAAVMSGVRVSIFSLVAMRLRRVRADRVIKPLIKGTKAGLNVSLNQLESHLLSGGRVDNVIDALIAAQRARLELTFERAVAIDLAGRDVFEAVRMSVNPKIIVTPWVSGVAKNGIEVKVVAKITVRANIGRLVGGAGEETIIARVGEGVVATVGQSDSHKDVLENPNRISQMVLAKGLDSGTAFEILSIDIADVEVGRNIGAELQIDQANADKVIAQARAEERRSLAVAREQEMVAQVQEMRSKVVEAEAQIPMAVAAALQSGNLGVMDYYNLENKKADTKMRDGIGKIAPEVAAKVTKPK